MRLRSLLLLASAVIGLSTPAMAQLDGGVAEGLGDTLAAGQIENDPSNLLISAIPAGELAPDVSTLSMVVSALDELNSETILAAYSGSRLAHSAVASPLVASLPIPSGPWGTWTGRVGGFSPEMASASSTAPDRLASTPDNGGFEEVQFEVGSSEGDLAVGATSNTLTFASAAQPAAIEPIGQTSFVVFFDWDSAVLSADANSILDTAVLVASETGSASLLLDGHTDGSTSASYNQDLSRLRAQSAAEGLISRGLAPEEIVIRVFGEENPAMPAEAVEGQAPSRIVEIIVS
ncbi:MAG: OmpA family protein [Pseudomonadota bacterium]